MFFLEASAKEATNVEEAFLTMAKELIEIRAQMGEQVNTGAQQVSFSRDVVHQSAAADAAPACFCSPPAPLYLPMCRAAADSRWRERQEEVLLS